MANCTNCGYSDEAYITYKKIIKDVQPYFNQLYLNKELQIYFYINDKYYLHCYILEDKKNTRIFIAKE